MVIGAIIGGVAGSQVGSGNGRKVAIVGGAAAGALIGRHVATRGDNDRDVSYSCRERNGRYQEQRLAGYDVAYSFHGRRHELRTHYEPGRYLRLRIEVVAEE